MPLAPPEPVGRSFEDRSGCQESIGYVIDLNPPGGGGAACVLDLRPEHLNRNGLMHGGIVAMMLDVACGYSSARWFDPENVAPLLTVSLNLHYVSSVSAGRVTATGRVSGGGYKICYANGELHDSDGKLIATAAGVFKRITKRPTT